MSNLYEKQAFDNYLNNGITHVTKISYGILGRNQNEIAQQPVYYERQNIIMNSKRNSNKNENNSKISVIELLNKKKRLILKQKYMLLQKLTKEEDEIWKKMRITLSDIDIYLAENNASSDCQVKKLDNYEIN